MPLISPSHNYHDDTLPRKCSPGLAFCATLGCTLLPIWLPIVFYLPPITTSRRPEIKGTLESSFAACFLVQVGNTRQLQPHEHPTDIFFREKGIRHHNEKCYYSLLQLLVQRAAPSTNPPLPTKQCEADV